MCFGRIIFGASVLLLLTNCSSSYYSEKYPLRDTDTGWPASIDSAAEKTAREEHKIARTPVHRPVAAATTVEGGTKSAAKPSVVQDQVPARYSSDRSLSENDADPAVVEAAMGHRKPKFSIPAGSIEQMAREDPEAVTLKAKTNICRGC